MAPHVTKQPRRWGKLVAHSLHCMLCGSHRQSRHLSERRNILASFPTVCVKMFSVCEGIHFDWLTINDWCILQSNWATWFHATAQVNDSSDTRLFHIDVKERGGQTKVTLVTCNSVTLLAVFAVYEISHGTFYKSLANRQWSGSKQHTEVNTCNNTHTVTNTCSDVHVLPAHFEAQEVWPKSSDHSSLNREVVLDHAVYT